MELEVDVPAAVGVLLVLFAVDRLAGVWWACLLLGLVLVAVAFVNWRHGRKPTP